MRAWPLLLVVMTGCAAAPSDEKSRDPHAFDDVTAASGVIHEQLWGDTLGARFQGGVCVFDVDGDGQRDLLFPGFPSSHLYIAHGNWRFSEETSARGLGDTGMPLGCAVFDVDADGDLDLVLAGDATLRLFENQEGRFLDVTTRLGAQLPEGVLATSVVAWDADEDGDLDLAVGIYGVFSSSRSCRIDCRLIPESYEGGHVLMLMQNADGSFSDDTVHLARTAGPALVLAATDLDADGHVDLFVGNDVNPAPDQYFTRAFVDEVGALGGLVSSRGTHICSMSATDGDVDNDGLLDLTESTWSSEPSSIFRCNAGGCSDVAEDLGLRDTPRNVRWGQLLVDFDDDGIPELFEAMGHIYGAEDFDDLHDTPEGLGLITQTPLLWHRPSTNTPFALGGGPWSIPGQTAGRGAVAADLDGDGDLDVVVGTARGRPLLLENVHPARGHALEISLRGAGKNARGVGARIIVTTETKRIAAMVHAGGGYHSGDDGTVHLGLGSDARADLEIFWPDGRRTVKQGVTAGSILVEEEP